MRLTAFSSLVAVMMLSACAEMQSLDRGLYGASNFVGGADRITGQRTLGGQANREEQIQRGAQASAQTVQDIQAQGGKVNAELDAAQYARVVKITSRILAVSHFADEKDQWKVLLLPGDEWNAYVNGGNIIHVYRKLAADKDMTDEGIAAVIGHEIAHIAANHIDEKGTYTTAATLTGGKSVRRSTFQASFQVEQENEADKIGILYAALAGYDPFAASRVWQRMYDKVGSGQYQFLSDHPLNRERAAQTRAIAQAVVNAGYYTPGAANPNAPSLLIDNVFWHKKAETLKAGEGGGLAALAETAFTAYTQRTETKNRERSQLAHQQMMKSVSQLISFQRVEALDDDSVRLGFVYRGTQPLSMLTITAIGPGFSEPLAARIHGRVVASDNLYPLVFKKEGIGKSVNSLRFAVDDAAF